MSPHEPHFYHSGIYALGSNGSGQLGIGHKEDVSTPESVKTKQNSPPADVKHIASGGNHTVVLYTNDVLLTAGDNSDGRCFRVADDETSALGGVASCDTLGSVVKHVAATWTATLLALEKGVIWVCGSGNSGELGLGKGVTESRNGSLISFPPRGPKVVRLASCMGHVVAVLSNGEVWGWGKGRKGQLGEPAENCWEPRKIEGIPFFATEAVCGKDFTCVFGPPSTGEVLVLGPSSNDRFGVRTNAPRTVPGWRQVAASWGSIFVLVESGILISWGRDDHGQLPPPHLPRLKSIAAGSEHCLALTGSGTVLAWGWGEHGNCGQPTDSSGDVSQRWNELKVPWQPLSLFAGCATSFVVTRNAAHSDEG